MTEFRHTSGAIKTELEIRNENPNTSFPIVISSSTMLELGYSPIFPVTAPTPSAKTKVVVRDGIEQDSKKNWVYKWKEQDRFSDIEDGKTKAEQDAEYQTQLDNIQKDALRVERDPLLAEADWQIHKIEDANGDTSAWRTYRQKLRDITKASDIYDVTWPTKPS